MNARARIYDHVHPANGHRLHAGPAEKRTPFGLDPVLLEPDGYSRLVEAFHERTHGNPNVWLFLWHPFGLGPEFVSWPRKKAGGMTPQRFDTAMHVAQTEHAHILEDFVRAVSPIAERTIVYLGSPFLTMQPAKAWTYCLDSLRLAGVHRVYFDALGNIEDENTIGRAILEMLAEGTDVGVGAEPNVMHTAPGFDLVKGIPACGDWIHGKNAVKHGRLEPHELPDESFFWVHRHDWEDGDRRQMSDAEVVSTAFKILDEWGVGAAVQFENLDAYWRQTMLTKADRLAAGRSSDQASVVPQTAA